MMVLTFAREGRCKGITLTLPMTDEGVEVHMKMMQIMGRQGSEYHLQEVECEIPELFSYIDRADVGSREDLKILSDLTCRIEAWGSEEKQVFAGALAAARADGLEEVLAVADSLDDFELIPGIHDLKDLGRHLVETGYLSVSEHLLPHINYASVGQEYQDNFGGAYCPLGYVRRKDIHPAMDQNREAVFTANLRWYDGNPALSLRLPASDAWLHHAKEVLKIADFCQVRIDPLECSIPYLSELLPTECFSVEDANELALAVEEMQKTDGELLKFCSVLAVEKPQDFPAAVKLAKGMDNYERVPTSEEEYGREALRRIGADDELLDTIDGYMNFSAFGDACMVEDGVAVTSFGAVRRLDEPFPSDQIQSQQMM